MTFVCAIMHYKFFFNVNSDNTLYILVLHTPSSVIVKTGQKCTFSGAEIDNKFIRWSSAISLAKGAIHEFSSVVPDEMGSPGILTIPLEARGMFKGTFYFQIIDNILPYG